MIKLINVTKIFVLKVAKPNIAVDETLVIFILNALLTFVIYR